MRSAAGPASVVSESLLCDAAKKAFFFFETVRRLGKKCRYIINRIEPKREWQVFFFSCPLFARYNFSYAR